MKRKVMLDNIISESINKVLNEGVSKYPTVEKCYNDYMSAQKELIASLRALVYKGDKKANKALYEFVRNHATYGIEDLLEINNK